VPIEKGRGQCVAGSYQNYQNGVVNNQLNDGGRGVECVGDGSESVDVEVVGGGGSHSTVNYTV
jgi:hypothetical protein